MPVEAIRKPYLSFVGGIVTEASPLVFPEDTAKDMDNFVLGRDGSVKRRLGVDFEEDYVLKNSTLASANHDNDAKGTHVWRNVGNNPNLQFVVIQMGRAVYFADMYDDSPSTAFKNGGNRILLSGSGNNLITVASVNGDLVVTGDDFDPFYFTYDSATDTVTSNVLQFAIRDMFGIDDSLTVNDRPTLLSSAHKYNLLNQGWEDTNITAYYASQTVYPSNADIQALGKDTSDDFDPPTLDKQFFGTTPAPKGRYIIDAFTRGASRSEQATVYTVRDYTIDFETGFSIPSAGIPSTVSVSGDVETGRFSTCAAFAGRMWYSGVISSITSGDANSPDYTGFVFFSQTVSNAGDLGKCYQEADPTSEHVSDLVDTDGGWVRIPDVTNILHLHATDSSLLVFAQNGIWEIAGDLERGFSATSFQVIAITDVGCLSDKSIVNVEGTILYWADGGIYAIQQDPTTGRRSVEPITSTTIQTLYDAIPRAARDNVKGVFDPATRKITWLYNDESTYDGISERNKYNRELVFDTLLQAFYTNTFGELATTSPFVSDLLIMPGYVSTTYSEDIVAEGDTVEADSVQVEITETALSRGSSYTKYLIVVPEAQYKFTFGSMRDGDFLDWESYDSTGIDYTSYLETGYEIAGDGSTRKQALYITMHFLRTETGFEEVGGDLLALNESSCLVTPRWDFANSSNSGKYGTQFQAYRLRNYIPDGPSDTFDYGQAVITTKSKVRGTGKALQLRIDSEAGKELQLLGWSIPFLIAGAP